MRKSLNVTLVIAIAAVLSANVLLTPTPAVAQEDSARMEQFTQLLQKVQTDPSGTGEKQVADLLKLSREIGRAYTASLAVKGYLSHNFRPNPSLILDAADAAMRAGDYRTAVTRYKSYIAAVESGEQASNVAAELYETLIDLLRSEEDAYQYMATRGSKLRESHAARRFDAWFLARSRNRGDFENYTARLADAVSGDMPLEAERLHYWAELDWIIDEVRKGDKAHYPAISHLRKVARAIAKDSKERSLRLRFFTAQLAFRAAAQGKDEERLARDFELVVSEAGEYFKAFSSADTLVDIGLAFTGGKLDKADESALNEQLAQKQQFMADCFAKLDDNQRDRFLAWSWSNDGAMHHKLIGRKQFGELASKLEKYFKQSEFTRDVRFDHAAHDMGKYKAQAKVLEGVASEDAAAIGAIVASGGDDMVKAVDHIVKEHAWHLRFDRAYDLMEHRVWPALNGMRPQDKPLGREVFGKAVVHYGEKYLSKSPAAYFDQEALRKYLEYAWDYDCSGDENKSKIIAHLKNLEWVGLERDNDRRDLMRGLQGRFRDWSNGIRRDANEYRRNKKRGRDIPQKVLDQIEPISQAIRDLADRQQVDPSKAPNELTKQFCLAEIAEDNRNQDEFIKAGREVFKIAKDAEKKKIHFAQATLDYVYRSRNHPINNIALQAEVVADLLDQYEPGKRNDRIIDMVNDIPRHRHRWAWWRINKDYQDDAMVLNAVFEKALVKQLDKGRLWGQLMDWFRGSRRGDGWSKLATGEEVIVKLIDKRILKDNDWRPGEDIRSETVAYMNLLTHEFPWQRKKYPVETHFDDMFVDEVKRIGYLDINYFRYGNDKEKKVANIAAQMLADVKTLPFGYNDEKITYRRNDFFDWQVRAMSAEPKQRDKMIAEIEKTYGKTRFDRFAAGAGYFGWQASLAEPEGRSTYFQRLRNYVPRHRTLVGRDDLPSFRALEGFEGAKASKEEIDTLLMVFDVAPHYWAGDRHYGNLARAVVTGLLAQQRETDLYPVIPHLWRIARNTRDADLQRMLAGVARTLLDRQHYDLAYVMSNTGPDLLSGEIQGDVKSNLQAVKSSALSQLGGVIPVAQSDPRYPIFASQVAYLTQRYKSAWDSYEKNKAKLRTMFRELDPNYVLWIIRKNTEVGNFVEAESLIQDMLQWIQNSTQGFDPEIKARLYVEYANIAFAQKNWAQAKAWYQKVADTEEYSGTKAQRDAELLIAEVDRMTKNYDAARQRLEKLARKPDLYLQTEAYYYLALLKFDQEQYQEARESLGKVLDRQRDHNLAKLLEGEINLKLRRIDIARDLDIGLSEDKKVIVPGKPLRVTLEDQNLAVIGRAQTIEIKAWTEKSGDVEKFTLRRFADSKTKFEGSMPTEIAPVTKGDNRLQLLGRDVLMYDFSDEFKEKNQITESEPFRLVVTTDGSLLSSSGKILTKAELAELEFRRQVNEKLGLKEDQQGSGLPLALRRATNQVKPGNAINVRVIDPDRSEKPVKDEVYVSVRSSSGDSIKRFVLVETDPHSGVFEGAIPTASGQPIAYASDSNTLKEPNFVISPKEYPAWEALPDNARPKTFTIDFNDNVPMGEMKIIAREAGRKLKDFYIQTSMNGKSFNTVGHYPETFQPWDGSLEASIVKWVGLTRLPRDVDEIKQYIDQDYLGQKVNKVTVKPGQISNKIGKDVMGKAGELKLDESDWYVAHFRGAFYQDRRKVRTIQLLNKAPDSQNIALYMSVDGQPVESGNRSRGRGDNDAGPAFTGIKKSLAMGVHTVDVYVVARRSATPDFEVLWNIDVEPYKQAIPGDAMDIKKVPQIREEIYVDPAKVTADKNGETFTVKFSERTRGRVVRILMADFETDAPAINKIEMTDATGKKILPTKEDFLELRKNDKLELIPGDKITITYEDPFVITTGQEKHETFLTATFFNGTISPAFVEYSMQKNERVARHVRMRRFEPGDTIVVFINDPDEDRTNEQDTVKFTANVSLGEPKTFIARETAPHSGVFEGRIFPVAKDPKRAEDLLVKPGADVELAYRDEENTDPGIPVERTTFVEQVWWEPPQVRVYKVTSRPLTDEELSTVKASSDDQQKRNEGKKADESALAREVVPIRRAMIAERPKLPDHTKPTPIMMEGPLLVEVLYPAIAKSTWSKATVYVQTSSGRKKHVDAGKQLSGPFDLAVPGTLKLTTPPSDVKQVDPPKGYLEVLVIGDPEATDPLHDGRFAVNVPMQLGAVPEQSFATEDAKLDPKSQTQPLMINGDDDIHVAFVYKDDKGKEHWVTHTVDLNSDNMFDVMDQKYRDPLNDLYVGENMYFRVLDMKKDVSNEKDRVQVELKSASGATKTIELVEDFGHTGTFKGLAKIVFEGDEQAARDPNAFPVRYGDTVTVTYKHADTSEGITHQLSIFKGADGAVIPFTKRFKDKEIAVQTQFTVAEAHFELAKRHRELGQEDISRRGIFRGKKLLEEAIADYPDVDARAQAEYLLAELEMEFANDAKDEEIKQQHYHTALRKFSDIVASYPQSKYASRSQYKKGIVYEKMGKLDEACEEYVKLSYRYPDSEFVADTINRLGLYFLRKGRAINDEAAKLKDKYEAEKLKMQARKMFTTAGEVFGRLAVRFPQHELSGMSTVKSAQCFMRAEEYSRAIRVFQRVIDDNNQDKDLRAEAMYWCGYSHMKNVPTPDYVNAYRMFTRLTWDYPATEWAKWARGWLASPELAKVKPE